MRYQSGNLRNPKEDDPEFDTYSEAFLHVARDSDCEAQGIWTGQSFGSELIAIVWEQQAYTQ